MKIKFPRKVKFTREIVVGLAVLLVLAVVLSVVAARQIMRHNEAVAAEDRFDQRKDERRDSDIETRRDGDFETRRDTFPPAVPVSISDPLSEHDKYKPREEKRDEKREEKREAKIEQAAQQGFATTKAPKLPAVAKIERREEAKQLRKVDELPTPPSLDSDDRYGAALAPAVIVPRERAEARQAKPLVIQVSGDSPDSLPRRMDGQMSEGRPDARRAELARGGNAFAGGGPVTPIAEADREHRDPRAIQSRNEMASPTTSYPAPYGYGATNPAVPEIRGPTDYPGASAGYGRSDNRANEFAARGEPPRDATARREDFPRPLADNPLRNDGRYEVQPNDSFWTISQRVYGSGAYFRALAEINRGKAARPDRLQPGLLISTPPVAQLEKEYPDLCPRPNRREAVRNRAVAAASLASYSGDRIYVVQEGDTLSSIARNELGKVSRWADIYQLNREQLGKDFDYLTPGMKLVMPPREGRDSDRTTRRSDEVPAPARY